MDSAHRPPLHCREHTQRREYRLERYSAEPIQDGYPNQTADCPSFSRTDPRRFSPASTCRALGSFEARIFESLLPLAEPCHKGSRERSGYQLEKAISSGCAPSGSVTVIWSPASNCKLPNRRAVRCSVQDKDRHATGLAHVDVYFRDEVERTRH